METYDDSSNDIEFWHVALGMMLFVVAQGVIPAPNFRRTAGANTTSFLGKDQKPILMQLKNCRVVPTDSPVSAPTPAPVITAPQG